MPTRTSPRQRRSQDKHDRLLVAAATLLEELPYDDIGTRLIADRAEVSVGSLYRFFPDRDAIFQALAEHWLDRLVELMDQQLDDLPATPAALIDRLVDSYAAFWRAEPGFRQVWSGGVALRVPQVVGDHYDEQLTGRLQAALTGPFALPADEGLHDRIVLAVNVTEFLLHRAFRLDPQGDPVVLAELKLLLRRYLVPNFGR